MDKIISPDNSDSSDSSDFSENKQDIQPSHEKFSIDISITQIAVSLAVIISLITFCTVIYMSAGGLIDTQPTQLDITPNHSSESSAESVYSASKPSVVTIYTQTNAGLRSQGTGFVYNNNGYIITNHHVINGNVQQLYVKYEDNTWANAEIVGTDIYVDLAVIDPDRPETPAPLPIAVDSPNVGESIYVIGSPHGLEYTLTSGVISGLNRTSPTSTQFVVPDMVQIEASLNNGNSGGPVLNKNGEVVGVARAREGENIGFAVSTDMIRAVVPNLIAEKQASHPFIGINSIEMTPYIAKANNINYTPGIGITNVVNETNASEVLTPGNGQITYNNQQMLLVGDIITHVDGIQITNNERLATVLIQNHSPGDTVELTIVSGDTTRTVEIELTDRPNVNNLGVKP